MASPAKYRVTRRPLLSRKLDLVYLVFFIIHIPVMLIVDLSAYYPVSVRPAFTISLREWYIMEYRDRFFTSPPAWFHAYMAMEVVYHLPVSFWALGALWRDDPMIPVQLLVFALQTGVTTLTCTAEMLSWDGYTVQELGRLCALYLPYLGLAMLMGIDMYLRLGYIIQAKTKEA